MRIALNLPDFGLSADPAAVADLRAELADAGATWWQPTPGFGCGPAEVLTLAAGGPLS